MERYEQACVAVAAALHISQAETSKDNVKKLVKEHLSADQAGPWLLVLDNADDHNILYGTEYAAGIIDYLPESEKGMTVFTTRVQELAVALTRGDVLELGYMSKVDAMNFLEKSLIRKNPTEECEELLDELAYLPLAISQAATYLNMNRTTFTRYLRLLRHIEQDTISLMSKEFQDQTRYEGSANAVASTAKSSYRVGRCLIFDVRFPEAVRWFEECSQCREVLDEGDPDRLEAQHELGVAYHLNGQIEEAVRLLEYVVKMLDATLVEAHPSRLASQQTLGVSYWQNGQFGDSRRLLEHVVKKQDTMLAETHFNQLASQHQLAVSYYGGGQAGDAIKLLEHVVKIQSTMLAQTHPNCLEAER
ncbi:hypothetical protein COCCADRAFT_3373 [Bipolaris zeicola 26-R-13]|uniref:NB-ARC domain-containing protein n=1 Tax=Cochliobolus carbonum (strain 26-R-13) TaxID=930089 RepID=W6Y786_COCC2|nr:uncharacterized protein COCCADRAFT_3373 [Bipolaris zeicola 26-R-13]EUC35462.1 hypothetical protein COCCADRAFT_3373 [Bipolaris zeicola 26-R-13]